MCHHTVCYHLLVVFGIELGRLATRQLLPAPRNGMQVEPVLASVGLRSLTMETELRCKPRSSAAGV